MVECEHQLRRDSADAPGVYHSSKTNATRKLHLNEVAKLALNS